MKVTNIYIYTPFLSVQLLITYTNFKCASIQSEPQFAPFKYTPKYDKKRIQDGRQKRATSVSST